MSSRLARLAAAPGVLRVLADSTWRIFSALARGTHHSPWRARLLPPGSRRQRAVRGALRRLVDMACLELRHQLGEVVSRVERSRGAVVFLPSIGWSVSLVQRPHHLARAFARRGYVSIFDTSNVDADLYGFAEIETNLFLFRGPSSWLRAVPRPILWTLPYNYHEAAAFPPGALVVYDWIDDLSVFTDHDGDLIRANHQRALSEADVVASVAGTLHAQVLARRPDALYLPNAVDEAHFGGSGVGVTDDAVVRRLRAEGRPIAGYYGALARWFDDELLEQTARRRPDWNFLLIGPDYDGTIVRRPLLDLANVTWIGPRAYATLPQYLAAFDVAMIPFRLNAITSATSPLKLYEYLAGGRPVVTTALPECQAHPEVDVVATSEEFAAALDRCRRKAEDPELWQRLRAVAASNTWFHRVQEVERALVRWPSRGDRAIAS